MNKDNQRDLKKQFEQAKTLFAQGDFGQAFRVFKTLEQVAEGDLKVQVTQHKQKIQISWDMVFAGVMATLVYLITWILVWR